MVEHPNFPAAQGENSNAPETLLLLLGAPDRFEPHAAVSGITRLMKLLFLASQEAGFTGADNFRFVPYKYGPFAPDLYDSLRLLRDYDLIEVTNTNTRDYYQVRELDELQESSVRRAAERFSHSLGSLSSGTQWIFRLTPLGLELVEKLAGKFGPKRVSRLADVKRRYAHRPLNELLAYVYQRYPEWAQNSVHPLAASKPSSSL